MLCIKTEATQGRLLLRNLLKKRLKSADQKSNKQPQDGETVAWQLHACRKGKKKCYLWA